MYVNKIFVLFDNGYCREIIGNNRCECIYLGYIKVLYSRIKIIFFWYFKEILIVFCLFLVYLS